MSDGYRCKNCRHQETEHELDAEALSHYGIDAANVCAIYTPTREETRFRARAAREALGSRRHNSMLLSLASSRGLADIDN